MKASLKARQTVCSPSIASCSKTHLIRFIASISLLGALSISAEAASVLGDCGDTNGLNLISDIQGDLSKMASHTSPLNGQTVVLEAIVTLDAQPAPLANGASSNRYQGFWIQEEAQDQDTLSTTSEGLFVASTLVDVSAGDRVRLRGVVSEEDSITQLGQVDVIDVCDSNNRLPTAMKIRLPVEDEQVFESLEGMRIQNQQLLVVADFYGAGYGFGNNGQLVASSRLHFQPTDIARPGTNEAQRIADDYVLDRLLVDDGVAASYPSFIPFPDNNGYSPDNPIRIGDTFQTLSGVMHHFEDDYMVVPGKYSIASTQPRTPAPHIAQNTNLVIASMNVLNYFNGDGQGGGFPTARGARTAEALLMQSDKIVAAITAMDADIVGLMELENDGFGANSAIQYLLDAVNQDQESGQEYRFVAPSVSEMGSDAIQVGLLYRPSVVDLVGTTRVLNSSTSPSDTEGVLFNDQRNRPAIVQSFKFEQQILTLVVNHLKSKGSSCGEPNEGGDGQGNCNIQRTRAAQGLVQYLATRPTGVNTDAVLVIGDLNAYSKEDPIVVFEQAGYVNLKHSDVATEQQPFSYSFSGRLGSLDHALASAELKPWVVSAGAWHINSVEDYLMDYQTEANGQRFSSIDNYAAPDAYRSSDHDPIVIGLNIPEAVNRAPVMDQQPGNISITTLNQAVSLDLSTNFSDPDGDALTYTATRIPSGWSLSSEGVLSGTANQPLIDSLPVTVSWNVSDGADSVSVSLSVINSLPENRAPVMDQQPGNISITTLNQAVSQDLSANFSDPDGDLLTFTATGLPAGWSLSSAGLITGEASQSVIDGLPATVFWVVSDGLSSAQGSLTIMDQLPDTPNDTGSGNDTGNSGGSSGGALSLEWLILLVGIGWMIRRRRQPTKA